MATSEAEVPRWPESQGGVQVITRVTRVLLEVRQEALAAPGPLA